MNKVLVSKLNVYLADLGVLYIKLHNLHWNVTGINFKAIHEYLEVLYDGVSASLDEVAEILKMNDEVPAASLKEYLEITSICELESKELIGKDALKIVLDDFSKIKDLAVEIRTLADENDEYKIIDMIEDDLNNFSKSIWFIKAMLK